MKSTELRKSVNSVHLKEPLFSKTYSSTVQYIKGKAPFQNVCLGPCSHEEWMV